MISEEEFERAVAKLRGEIDEACDCKDIEWSHGHADDALVEFLNDIGLPDIAKQYNDMEKWYA